MTRIFIAPATINGSGAYGVNGPRLLLTATRLRRTTIGALIWKPCKPPFCRWDLCRDSLLSAGNCRSVARSRSCARAAGPFRVDFGGANRDLRFNDCVPVDIVRSYCLALRRAWMESGKSGNRAGRPPYRDRHRASPRASALALVCSSVAFRQLGRAAPERGGRLAGYRAEADANTEFDPRRCLLSLWFSRLACGERNFCIAALFFAAFQRVFGGSAAAAIFGSSILFGNRALLPGTAAGWRIRLFSAQFLQACASGPGVWHRPSGLI